MSSDNKDDLAASLQTLTEQACLDALKIQRQASRIDKLNETSIDSFIKHLEVCKSRMKRDKIDHEHITFALDTARQFKKNRSV